MGFLVFAGILLSPASRAFAGSEGGGMPGAFLQFGVGARALGMGGAFYAISDDATAAYWNPAGLSYLQRKELTYMSAPMFVDTTLSYIGFAWPTATRGTFALGMTTLSSDGYEKVTATFDPTTEEPLSITQDGSFAVKKEALNLAWGKEVTDTIAMGLVLKGIERQVDDSKDNFLSMDIAAMRQMTPIYRLAFGVQNVFSRKGMGGKMMLGSAEDTDDRFPVIIKIGNSVKLFKERMQLGFDLEKSEASSLNWRFGSEYWAARWFAFRVGILAAPKIQEADWGFGFRFRRFQLDLAQGIHDLGASTRISATFKFGRSRDDRSAEQVKILIQQGFEAFKSGDFQLATLRLNQAVDAAPHNKQIRAMLARLQGVVGMIPQATGGEEYQTFVRKGVISYVDGRNLKGAINALRYAYNMNSKDENLLKFLNLVEKEFGSSEVTRRVEGPEKFTFVDQKIYDARQAIYDGKYDLAIRRTQDVLDLEPNNITALEIMGSAFFLMEDKDKAKAVWKRVIELDPKNKVVGEFLGQIN